MRLRRKPNEDETTDEVADTSDISEIGPDVPADDPRALGPWDSSEKQPGDDPTYIDLGSLIIKGHPELSLQLPTDGDSDVIGSAVLLTEDSGLELRAFAAARSGGLWAEVRADLVDEVERLGGHYEVVEGVFGTEMHVRVPVPDNPDLFQPSRIVGVEGPRWLLRATFLGDAGLNPSDEGILIDAFRDTIVVRGGEPMAPREALVIVLPEGAVMMTEDGEEAAEPTGE